jgi:hypothetical protein
MTALLLASLLRSGALAVSLPPLPGTGDVAGASPRVAAAPIGSFGQGGEKGDAGARDKANRRREKRKKRKDEGSRSEEEIVNGSPVRGWTTDPP